MKLSLDALNGRAGATASIDFLAAITTDTIDDCHNIPLLLVWNLPSNIKNVKEKSVLVSNPEKNK